MGLIPGYASQTQILIIRRRRLNGLMPTLARMLGPDGLAAYLRA